MSMISRYIFGTPIPTMAVVREIAPSGGEIPHFTVTKSGRQRLFHYHTG